MTYAPKGWTLAEPDHLRLGQLVVELTALDPDRVVPLGFGRPHSYRMDYSELAFEPAQNVTIGSMLEAAQGALGETFQGWKGGDYAMDCDTHCWLAFTGDPGESIGRVLLSLLVGEWCTASQESTF